MLTERSELRTFSRVRTIFSGIPLFLFLLMLGRSNAFAQEKQILTHDDVSDWELITENAISSDGRWVLWGVGADGKDQVLHIRRTNAGNGRPRTTWTISRAEDARFSPSSEFVVFQRAPAVNRVREMKLEDTPDDELPKDSLGVLHLASGTITMLASDAELKMPEEGDSWIAYLIDSADPDSSIEADPDKDDETSDPDSEVSGKTLVLRNLTTQDERTIAQVSSFAFSKTGNLLVYTRAPHDTEETADETQLDEGTGLETGSHDDADSSNVGGIYGIRPGYDAQNIIMSGPGTFSAFAIDDKGQQVAFLYNPTDDDQRSTDTELYLSVAGKKKAWKLADETNPEFESGWWISDKRELSFSKSGNRVYFGLAPPVLPALDDSTTLEEERMDLDIWAWTDPQLQPQQLRRSESERDRTYLAVFDQKTNRVIALASERVPEVTVSDEGDGWFALGTSNLPYQMLSSWDSPGYFDAFGINMKTGEKIHLLQQIQDTPRISPGGKFIYWWDRDDRNWRTRSTREDIEVNVTRALETRLDNEDHDWPYKPSSYGNAGWTNGDDLFLVYDRFDIWAVDPFGERAPKNITNGEGRKNDVRYRIIQTDPESPTFDPNQDLLLSSFHLGSKQAGFSTDRIAGEEPPYDYFLTEHRYSSPVKAKEADVYLFTRENYNDFPDLWISDTEFSAPLQISHENLQQDQFAWGSVELVRWTSVDGVRLEGMLFKPDGFDPNKKYPMVVNFYERNSQGLFRHRRPYFHRSTLNYTYYVSRGYLIFVPDIPYKTGYPGESAMNAVMPGITSLIDQGFVDRERIGAMGHSWGGYQIAYMVTQTNLFAAAVAGAPVSNMISAYGGIRWGSGMSRMFQYERTQSRIGGSLWEKPLRYIQNSPIFQADKIETPLMWQHNDHDGAVPWYQGIELFVALRRLGKPAWMLNYNGADHWVQKLHRRKDFNIRMQQFFDHYLMGTPAPVWMIEGIPAVMKNRTLGLKLMDQ